MPAAHFSEIKGWVPNGAGNVMAELLYAPSGTVNGGGAGAYRRMLSEYAYSRAHLVRHFAAKVISRTGRAHLAKRQDQRAEMELAIRAMVGRCACRHAAAPPATRTQPRGASVRTF
eukprot:1330015-Prymnesium_polylepis.1